MNLEQLLKSLPKKSAPENFTERVMVKISLLNKPFIQSIRIIWMVFIGVISLFIFSLYRSGIIEIVKMWINDGQLLSFDLTEWLNLILSEAPIYEFLLLLIISFFLIKKPKFNLPKFSL